MKKWLLQLVIVLIVLIAIGGTLLGVKIHKANEQRKEFYAFREYLDKDYIPSLKKTSKYLSTVAEENQSYNLQTWMLINNGSEQNTKLEENYQDFKEKLINKNLQYKDSQLLKKNVVKTSNDIIEITKLIDSFGSTSQFEPEGDPEAFAILFNPKVDQVTKDINEMNKLLSKYYK